jgi:hypothetical protein
MAFEAHDGSRASELVSLLQVPFVDLLLILVAQLETSDFHHWKGLK